MAMKPQVYTVTIYRPGRITQDYDVRGTLTGIEAWILTQFGDEAEVLQIAQKETPVIIDLIYNKDKDVREESKTF